MRSWFSSCALRLLVLLLTACASSTSSLREDFEAPEVYASWEHARADPGCVVLLCDEEPCSLWRCQDLEAGHDSSVQFVRAPLVLRPPSFSSPRRWWGHPLGIPDHAEPVFEIPWRNWKNRDQPPPKDLSFFCLPAPEPMEKHHIFPQQRVLARWFLQKGINIHEYTIPIPRSFHAYLHSGGSQGGMWNEAWRQFKDDNPDATPEEIWQFARDLMLRFRVNGNLIPYCR